MAKKHILSKVRSTPSKPRTVEPATHTFPCLPLKQGKLTMFIFAIEAKTLWTLVKINRRQEDKEKGYQRAISPSRVDKIAAYFNEGNAVPGAILVSFDKATVAEDGKSITIQNDEDAGWVIDGQHRLAGAHRSTKNLDLPVIAMLQLNLEEQIDFFVTINREQKGVPSSLYYDLLQHLPRRLTESEVIQERANDLVALLRRDAESPFYRRIVVTTSPKDGQLSSTNVIRKLSPHIRRDGRLVAFSDDERAGILNNLYLALEQVFPKEYVRPDTVFFRTVGFGAIMNVLPVLIDLTFSVAGKASFRVSDVAQTLRFVRDFDFDSWRQMGTGTAAENQAANDFRSRLQEEAGSSLKNRISL